jgi:hypothetical protein
MPSLFVSYPAIYSNLPAVDDDPLPDCTSSSRIPLLPAVYLTPAIDEEEEEDPFGCNGTSLPFFLSSLRLIPYLPQALSTPPPDLLLAR